ncbi:MAG: DUF167 domain-containing protein [Chlamydiales bacterium]|nr:DUF167 domain-containing protein [Chlamydiales bacterium]
MKISVKVLPKSSKNEIVGWENDVLKVRLTAVPEKGKANEALISLLAKEYGVPKSAITILKGTSSQRKVVEIKGAPTSKS